MTTINDISDFVRILRENPDWAETIRSILLSRELLELPERFAAFVESTNQNFQLVNQRLDRLEADMVVVKSDLTVLKSDMVQVKGIVGNLSGRVDNLSGRVDNLSGRVDNLSGSDYEFKVEKNIGSLAGEYLRIRRTKVLKGPRTGLDYEFTERVEDAEDNGVITEEQNHELDRSDLIFAGRRRADGAELYVAAEISITIGNTDITRAAHRASILELVTGQPVLPAVIGAHIDEDRTALAKANSVAVILRADD